MLNKELAEELQKPIIRKFEKGSEINAIPLCLGNISRDVSVDNVKKAG